MEAIRRFIRCRERIRMWSTRGGWSCGRHDVVDFAVGYGTNGTHFSDTTGLFAVVRVLK
jgi:hypothetical protein